MEPSHPDSRAAFPNTREREEELHRAERTQRVLSPESTGEVKTMDGEEAAKLMLRARELRELAEIIKTERYRTLLLESADSFERLARRVLETEKSH